MPYYFKLPSYDDLNAKQRVAARDVGSVLITGGPGTGKSVVAVWRHIVNYESSRRKSLLITYTKTLRYFLAKSIYSYAELEEDPNKQQRIFTAYNAVEFASSWEGVPYDEIIIDEAQDLPEYCWITRTKQERLGSHFQNIARDTKCIKDINGQINNGRSILKIGDKSYPIGSWIEIDEGRQRFMLSAIRNSIRYIARFSDRMSFGIDNNQILYPERATTQERIEEIYNIQADRIHRLNVNYRNTYEILNYVKHALDYNISHDLLERLKEDQARRGMLPILKLVDSYADEQNSQILEILNDYNDGTANIAILLPLKNQVRQMRDFLSGNGYQLFGHDDKAFSFYISNDEEFKRIDNIHITTYKSSKGLEFDTVILPYYGRYNDYLNDLDVVNEEDYYVALTRARTNLLLISDTDLDMPTSVLNRELFEIDMSEQTSTEIDINDDLPF